MADSVILTVFSEKQRLTLKLIAEYLRSRGQRCFTYHGLHRYWEGSRIRRGIDWHTVERAVRKLAKWGWLKRIEKRIDYRRKSIFCLTENLEHELRKLGWL